MADPAAPAPDVPDPTEAMRQSFAQARERRAARAPAPEVDTAAIRARHHLWGTATPTPMGCTRCDGHRTSPCDAQVLADALDAARTKVARWETDFPCDGLCTDAPEEDCSRHGRRPAELWEMASAVQSQRDAGWTESRAETAAVREELAAAKADLAKWKDLAESVAVSRDRWVDLRRISEDRAEVAEADLAAARAAIGRAEAEALTAAADAADGMHDPPAPDCHEWAEWLCARARAALSPPAPTVAPAHDSSCCMTVAGATGPHPDCPGVAVLRAAGSPAPPAAGWCDCAAAPTHTFEPDDIGECAWCEDPQPASAHPRLGPAGRGTADQPASGGTADGEPAPAALAGTIPGVTGYTVAELRLIWEQMRAASSAYSMAELRLACMTVGLVNQIQPMRDALASQSAAGGARTTEPEPAPCPVHGPPCTFDPHKPLGQRG